jgi:hypothetical protein
MLHDQRDMNTTHRIKAVFWCVTCTLNVRFSRQRFLSRCSQMKASTSFTRPMGKARNVKTARLNGAMLWCGMNYTEPDGYRSDWD